MREIAHVSDGAIDHIEAFLAILLSLSLTQGPGGGAVKILMSKNKRWVTESVTQ